MEWRSSAVVAALAMTLSGVLATELDSAAAPRRHPADASHSAPVAPISAPRASGADALDRPVFAASRRPPAAQVLAEPSRRPDAPRVTGIIITKSQRLALLMPAGASAGVAMGEGGRVGDYTVRRIDFGTVTLTGPEGDVRLRPTPQPTPSLVASAPPPVVPVPPSINED